MPEHDASTGAPIREYVWLGDIPVAVIEAGTSPTVYWIHPDHLGRPIAMTDAAGAFVNETTWVAFGGIHVMTGSIGLDLRFPGQWHQHEGGLHYNWHRSYDPTIARYTQPDPLGLVDGPSRYAYVGSDPLQRVDPSGLAELPFLTTFRAAHGPQRVPVSSRAITMVRRRSPAHDPSASMCLRKGWGAQPARRAIGNLKRRANQVGTDMT